MHTFRSARATPLLTSDGRGRYRTAQHTEASGHLELAHVLRAALDLPSGHQCRALNLAPYFAAGRVFLGKKPDDARSVVSQSHVDPRHPFRLCGDARQNRLADLDAMLGIFVL